MEPVKDRYSKKYLHTAEEGLDYETLLIAFAYKSVDLDEVEGHYWKNRSTSTSHCCEETFKSLK